MAKITVRRAWSEGKPGKVSNKDRPASMLDFTPEDLASGVDISALQFDEAVEYDLVNGKVTNLRLLPSKEAPPNSAEQAPVPETSRPEPPDKPASAADKAPAAASKPRSAPAKTADVQGRLAAQDCAQRDGAPSLPGSSPGTPAPYTFVRIRKDKKGADALLDDLVTHDGVNTSGLLSGEVDLELRALTPLLAGQHRYDWKQLRAADDTQLIQGDFSDAKKILEPAIVEIGANGPAVVPAGREIPAASWQHKHTIIPASSVKGPIRQAIGAILNAPMERVGERRMSYRPNVDVPAMKQESLGQLRLGCYAAVVANAPKEGESVTVKLLKKMNDVLFVETPGDEGLSARAQEDLNPATKGVQRRIRGIYQPPILAQRVIGGRTYIDDYRKDQNRLVYASGDSWETDTARRVCDYACGIDGAFELAQMTKDLHERKQASGGEDGGPMTARHYFRALVPAAERSWHSDEKTIGIDLIAVHQQMLEDLVDRDSGHLSRLPRGLWGPNLSDADIKARKEEVEQKIRTNGLRQYQLIYVEATLRPDGEPDKIVSFGTHFRYRWPYSSSVREVSIDPETGKGEVRKILKPAENETVSSDNGRVAGKLSAARSLFGYVSDEDTSTDAFADADKNFGRFAGRVAFNHAVEVVDGDRWRPEERFLHFQASKDDARFLLPLRILGAPKPTAVEHYIQQDGVESQSAATITYGDLPGQPGGELNGRKFYRHFPNGPATGGLTGNEPFLAEDASACRTDQATLARFVSRSDTRYRLRMRFRDLRPWELGALLVAADPNLLTQLPDAQLGPVVKDFLHSARAAAGPNNSDPLFAQKLGYGRPLGLGSVLIPAKALRLVKNQSRLEAQDLPALTSEAVGAFLETIRGRETALLDWLTVSRFAGQIPTDYPRASSNTENNKIYIYHTNIRLRHAEKRRALALGGETPDKRIWPDPKGARPG